MCFIQQTQQTFHGLWGHSDAWIGFQSQRLAAKPRPLGEVLYACFVHSGLSYGENNTIGEGLLP